MRLSVLRIVNERVIPVVPIDLDFLLVLFLFLALVLLVILFLLLAPQILTAVFSATGVGWRALQGGRWGEGPPPRLVAPAGGAARALSGACCFPGLPLVT